MNVDKLIILMGVVFVAGGGLLMLISFMTNRPDPMGKPIEIAKPENFAPDYYKESPLKLSATKIIYQFLLHERSHRRTLDE